MAHRVNTHLSVTSNINESFNANHTIPSNMNKLIDFKGDSNMHSSHSQKFQEVVHVYKPWRPHMFILPSYPVEECRCWNIPAYMPSWRFRGPTVYHVAKQQQGDTKHQEGKGENWLVIMVRNLLHIQIVSQMWGKATGILSNTAHLLCLHFESYGLEDYHFVNISGTSIICGSIQLVLAGNPGKGLWK